jgi:hypothetical protein
VPGVAGHRSLVTGQSRAAGSVFCRLFDVKHYFGANGFDSRPFRSPFPVSRFPSDLCGREQ